MPVISSASEKTLPQVLVQPQDLFSGTPELNRPTGYLVPSKVRELRKDPTIALARQLVTAPVLISDWSIKSTKKAPAGAEEFIAEQLVPIKNHVLKHGFLGSIDFGWQPFEKVLGVNDEGYNVITKFKPLLQDYTDILVDKRNGRFMGLIQDVDNTEVILSVDNSLSLSTDIEGTDWYGQSVMSILEKTQKKWDEVQESADRFDNKAAGAHWVVHYPEGVSMLNGVETPNHEIAQTVLNNLKSSGAIAIPNKLEQWFMDMDSTQKDAPRAWRVEILSPAGNIQTTFIDRLRYLDALKIRAFGFPERAVLEGQFGTKAEATEHADLGIMNIEVKHQSIVILLNWHVVNQLLRMNYGPEYENTVFIKPAPIIDARRAILKEIFSRFLQNGEVAPTIVQQLHTEGIAEEIGLPLATQASREAT